MTAKSPRPDTPRHRVRRLPERGRYGFDDACAVLDAGWLAHVGFGGDASPFVIPMLYARDGDRLLLHGSIASRLMTTLADGIACCVAVTHVDGLVLARSQFNHSVNYRSVVVFGHARPVDDPAEKARCLARFVDAIVPGRSADARAADRNEAAATRVLALPIAEFSVKVRDGDPDDHRDDMARRTWAGVIPLATTIAPARPAADLADGIAWPAYLDQRFIAPG